MKRVKHGQASIRNKICKKYKKALGELNKIIDSIKKHDNINDDIKKETISYQFFHFILKNFPENGQLEDLIEITSETIGKNPEFASGIIDGFTQYYISKKESLKDIGAYISEIINDSEIKGKSDLVFNIITSFVQDCLAQKPNNIQEIAEGFSSSLNGTEYKGKLKPIFSLIVSKYFMNTLTNSSNKQLSEKDKQYKKETEEQLFECYKKLPHEGDNEKINSFKDIPLKELSKLQEEYLKERFKKRGVDGGVAYEVFLKTACNLMFKSEGNEKLTVGDSEKQKDDSKLTIEDLENKRDIFKDLKFINLRDDDNIKSKKELFNAIGLQEADFGNEESGFSIVHCSCLKHAFVMIIDKTKTWNFATDSDNKSIYLIDSSRFIKKAKKNSKFDSIFKDKNEIFDLTPTLNENDYQENGTCWLNTMSAVGFLLEEQQNGLSIGKLRENFNIKRIKKSAKSKENIKPIISSEGLSSFEQGICDYSTEHFYPLTNISDKEKNIIKEFLRDKIEQNKVEQEELSTKSNRLEKLKEEQYKTKNLIIQGKYLKESLERITENDKKLKELCDKFDIKDIQCNKKQKSNQLSSRSSSNNTKRRKTKGRTMKSVVYLTI